MSTLIRRLPELPKNPGPLDEATYLVEEMLQLKGMKLMLDFYPT